MIAAIHQPNFFPWLGYFRKMVVADKFVFLDAVQIIKKGGSWANGVKVLVNGDGKWITVPILRGHGVQNINQVIINNSVPWQKKVIKTIKQNYTEHSVDTELSCPECNVSFQVYGIFGFCPG